MDEDKKFQDVHWADNSAKRVIETFPNEQVYTVASGITPSGFIHVGNFREVITTEMVRRALEDKGHKTKFIYSWDSYDAFRKVPNDVPKEWEKYLRMPVGIVPNPFGEGTYGGQFMKYFEDEVKPFNFPVEFQKQHEIQTSGVYADSIKKVLNNKNIVIEELNKYREVPLENSWWPIDVYDNQTKKDDNTILSYDGEYTIKYKTQEGEEKEVNFKEDPRVKLRWKADWPMRWNHFSVCFEPGGKDHSTPGSSYTTGKEIVKRIFNREPPVYTMYDFVKVKGIGGKISSSKGGALRIKDILKIYTPEMVLYLFAGTRPNSEIDISFDVDVIKIYEDFDKLERFYFGLEEEKNPKQFANKKRIYELSIPNGISIPKEIPFQPSLRHLSVVSQANDFDFEKVKQYYSENLKTDFDLKRLEQRFICSKNWLEKYAPEEFIFKLNSNVVVSNHQEKEIILKLIEKIEESTNADELMPKFKDICEEFQISVRDFFQLVYKVLISKEKGPKLASFIIENKDKILNLLKSEIKVEEKIIEDLDEIKTLNLKVGQVIEVKKHPESSKLLIFKVDIGEEDPRQILSGIQKYYTEEELKNKKIIVLSNLKKAKLAGEISDGMILAVEGENDKVKLLTSDLEVGSNLTWNNTKLNNENQIKIDKFFEFEITSKNGEIFYKQIKFNNLTVDEKISGKVC